MKSKIILSLIVDIIFYIKKNIKYILLLSLIPLSEIKAIFYDSDLKVKWFLFAENKKLLCNVVESYSNIIIFGIVFYFLAFIKTDVNIRKICLFLFVINLLDLFFIGLMGNALYPLKIFLSIIIYSILCRRLKFSSMQ